MKAHSLFVSFALTLGVAQGNWPMFRGPNGSGVSETAKPPVKIGPEENVLWKIDVPSSPSSPTVWGDKIFLTTFHEGRLETRAYDRRDGKQLWSKAAPLETLEEYHATEGSPASAAPATDGERVVSYFGSCGLVCYDMNGQELWRHKLPTVKTDGNFGSGASPLIAEGLVIVNRDQSKTSSLLAVDLRTGEKKWETPRPGAPTSYGTPIVWKHGEETEIVMAGSLTVRGYDPKTGAERWVVKGVCSYNCTTPVVGDGLLFFAGWSPGKSDAPWPSWEETVRKQDANKDGVISLEEFSDGPVWFKAQDIDADGKIEREDWDAIGGLMARGENVMVAIKPGGGGDVTNTHVEWRFTKGLPYVPSPLLYQDRLYLVRDGGIASCLNPRTGQPIYAQKRLKAAGSYYSSPVAADGRVYMASLNGVVTVLKAGAEQPEVIHQADFGERISATPALVGANLYLRTETKLYAFGPK